MSTQKALIHNSTPAGLDSPVLLPWEGCTQLLIDTEKIIDNLHSLKKQLPTDTKIMAIIKASGYATDDITLAKLFDANKMVEMFGVAYADEGIILRKSGIQVPIFVTHAPPFESSKIVQWSLEVAVDTFDCIDALAAEASLQNKQVRVHLHVDTGMNRFGCRPEAALELAQAIVSHDSLELAGILSHCHSADIPEFDPLTLHQAVLLESVITLLEAEGFTLPLKHIANSSAATRFHFPQYNLVRVGLALYGIQASQAIQTSSALQPALTLQSRIIHIKTCLQGEQISYGGIHTVTKPNARIATVPIGYHDGIHRCYGEKGFCLIHGQRAQIVGNVCMDFVMIDITDIPEASLGDVVTFFGKDASGQTLPPEEFAAWGGTIPHELISCLGPRIQRIWL